MHCLIAALTCTHAWSQDSRIVRADAGTSRMLRSLPLRSIYLGIDANEGQPGGSSATLTLGLTLDTPVEDWLHINVLVPEGCRIWGRAEGQWVPAYFLTYSLGARLEMRLSEIESDRLISFPIAVQTGEKQAWLKVFLRRYDRGYAAVVVVLDGGQPIWFSSPDDSGGFSYWTLMCTVSDALAFIGNVVEIDIRAADYLSPWCGTGMLVQDLDHLVGEVCRRAGCTFVSLGRTIIVDFVPSYRGAPDASWFVVDQERGIRFSAQNAPADELIPAIVEAVGGTIGVDDALRESRISQEWSGSFRAVLHAACEAAEPGLQWTEHEGIFDFAYSSQG